jgi:hypothetical protein
MQQNSGQSIKTSRNRRSANEMKEEYQLFVELYNHEYTPYEIMERMNISKTKYKNYFADAIMNNLINLVSHKYGTCFGRHLPKEFLPLLQTSENDLVRFEMTEEGLLLTKITKNADKNSER